MKWLLAPALACLLPCLSLAAETVDELVAKLEDKKSDLSARGQAAQALGKINGKKAINALREALKDEHLQYYAIVALGTMGPAAREAADDLAEIVEKDASKEEIVAFMRRQATESIGKIGHGSPKVIKALELCMSKRRCESAAVTLTQLGAPGADALVAAAVKYLSDKGQETGRFSEAYGILAYGTLPKDMIPTFTEHIKKGGYNARVAGRALASVGLPAKDGLVKLLDDNDQNVRAEAALSLSWMNFNAQAARRFRNEQVKDPVSASEVFPKLKAMLKRKDGTVDKRILDALVGIDQAKAMADPEIEKLVQNELLEMIKALDKLDRQK